MKENVPKRSCLGQSGYVKDSGGRKNRFSKRGDGSKEKMFAAETSKNTILQKNHKTFKNLNDDDDDVDDIAVLTTEPEFIPSLWQNVAESCKVETM